MLDIISERKGIIPYEKIVNMNSLFCTPENGTFFEKTGLFSNLKQKAVSDEDYTTSFYLYRTLKMHHLGEMNDLHNVQDVVLLSQICENRFQFMDDRYGFNPRKYNSAWTLRAASKEKCLKSLLPYRLRMKY